MDAPAIFVLLGEPVALARSETEEIYHLTHTRSRMYTHLWRAWRLGGTWHGTWRRCRALAPLWERPRTWEPAQARTCQYTHTHTRTHMHTHRPAADISRRALGKETARKSARGHKVSQIAATTVLEEEQAAVATAGAQSSGARRRATSISQRPRPLPPVPLPPTDHRRQSSVRRGASRLLLAGVGVWLTCDAPLHLAQLELCSATTAARPWLPPLACTQSAVRRSFQQLRRRRLQSVNVVNFQWTVFISNFMHMRDKPVCGF